ncbi:HEC/Ndc80p family-domain-containing protein [Tuber borchii]|uniref:Kinetochore protein NDC80 n=1 Tax=Tuber borchii TaxID=42251 RepID=A0A2T7A7D6_TUBBO|nr:HEC/Ndc80p family-domain-containing protein [Tuber borchii]
MSQDPNLFSAFKRPRETISGIPSSGMYNSGIPQPASALKRSNSNSRSSNSRMSLAARPAHNQPDIMSTAKRDPSRYSARKSYAPSSHPPPSQRRSSVMRRSSMGVAAFSQMNSFFSSAASAAVQRDPRPLKDSGYRHQIAGKVFEYVVNNGFELEMKYALGPNSLKSPTQKDFSMVFQWLYKRLDPNYNFQKAIENEVLPILKTLRYPYASTITKSQLAAVGSMNSWPQFLGILHWMMELVVTMKRFQSGEFDDAAAAEGVDIAAEKIIFRYFTRCYSAWLVENDDHDEFLKEMAASFEDRQSGYKEELEMLESENEKLKKQLEEIDDPLKKLEEHLIHLEGDKKRFVTWAERREPHIAKATASNQRLKEEIEAVERELAELTAEKKSLQEAVDRQGLTPADIDRTNNDREKLSKSLSLISSKITEAKIQLAERESEASSKLEALERSISRYNSLAYQIGIIPSSSRNAEGKDFELLILPTQTPENKLLADEVGYQPAQLLNRDLRHDIKPALNRLRQEIGARIHEAQDEAIKTQELIDCVVETLADKKDEVDTLQAKLRTVVDEYQELKETLAAEGNSSNAEIEKLEKELASMRLNMPNGALALEQRMQSVTIERDQLEHACHALREKFHGEVDKMLHEVIKFKVHIQESLENYENLAEEELADNDKLLDS